MRNLFIIKHLKHAFYARPLLFCLNYEIARTLCTGFMIDLPVDIGQLKSVIILRDKKIIYRENFFLYLNFS